MKSSIERRIAAGFVLSLTALGLIGFLAYQSVREFAESNESVLESHRLVQSTERLLALSMDWVGAAKDYVRTSDPRFLQGLEASAVELNDELNRLSEMAPEDAVQRKRLQDFRFLVKGEMDVVDEIAFLRSSRRPAAALEARLSGQTKEWLSAVRAALSDIQSYELDRLEKRKDLADRRGRRVLMLILPGVALSLLIIGLSGLKIVRDVRKIGRADDAVRRSVSSLRMLQTVAVAANQAAAVEDAMQDCLDRICALAGWPVGHYLQVARPSRELLPTGVWHLDDPARFREFRAASETLSLSSSDSLPGRVAAGRRPVWVIDIAQDPDFPRARAADACGLRSAFAFPVLVGSEVAGVLEFFSTRTIEPDHSMIDLMAYVGTQLGRVVERQRAREGLQAVNDSLERKVLERTGELLRRTQELEQSNKELGQFAYTVSHDLQEPLSLILSYVKLLARRYRDRLDREGNEFLDIAMDECSRMRGLIKDLLEYSLVSALADTYEGTVDCAAAVERALAPLQETLDSAGATVHCGPLPTLVADDLQLVRLFQNLVSNAVKFRGDRPPEVRISAEREEGGWRFCVQDNGIGIEREHYDRIFTIFQRLHIDEYPGSGIGLAICKKIVESHGGRIWVESEPGKGSRFYFLLRDRSAKRVPSASAGSAAQTAHP